MARKVVVQHGASAVRVARALPGTSHDPLTRLLGDRWPFWLSVHLLYYTRRTIRRQLEDARFEVQAIKPYLQTLPFGYVLERARPYVPPAGWLLPAVKAFGLKDLRLTYHVGQTFVISRKSDKQ